MNAPKADEGMNKYKKKISLSRVVCFTKHFAENAAETDGSRAFTFQKI